MGPKVKRSISYVKKQFQYRKPIFPFISSTFQDFQVERDILVKKVFPRINALCHERGTYCAPVDLRWGINDSQTNSGLVIQLCLDYIDRCAPFFICLLGERYGSHRPVSHEPLPEHYDDLCPSCHWLDRNLVIASSAGYDWVLDEKYQHCSITELEVIHAAFDRRNEYCRFYFRQPDHVDNLYTHLPEEERAEKLRVFEPESEYSNAKLRELKAQIAKHGLPIKYFKSPEELAVMVLQDWSDIVDQLYPPLQDFVLDTYSERFTEWMAHETFAETRRRIFVRTPEIDKVFHELTKFALTSLTEDKTTPPEPLDALSHMASHLCITRHRSYNRSPPCPTYKSVLLLTGDRGCGKTSVLANWVQEFSSRDDLKVFAHYVGSSALSFDIMCFMRRCTVEMRDKGPQLQRAESDVPDTDELADFHRVREAFLAAISLGPCVIVIDGVDELTGTYSLSQQQVKDFQWLPPVLPPQCKIIITLATCNTAFKSLSQRGSTLQVTVPPLLKTRWKTEVIQEHLAIHCKCLSDEQLKRIVKCRLSDKPLFLSILANELQVFGVYSRLDYHLDSYLESTSIRELWTRVIRRWIKDYGCPTDAVTLASTSCNAPESLTGWVADALRLIAVSRHGLSQVEILQILNTQLGYTDVTSFEWALFQSAAMDSLFARPGGLLKFFHQHFKDAVEYSLLGCVSDIMCRQQRAAPPTRCEMAFHKQLAKFFYDQPHSSRRTEELPWHLERSGEHAKLCSLLSDTKVFLYMYGADKFYMNSKRLDLIHYWKGLLQNNYNPGTTYKDMIQTVRGSDAPAMEMEDAVEDLLPVSLALELPSGEAGVFSSMEKEDDSHSKFFLGEPDPAKSIVKRHDSIQNSLIDFNDCSMVELASLANKVGQFLSVMEHFKEAEEVLLDAHHSLYESICLDTEGQKMLSALQESTATLFYYQLKTRPAMAWYRKALSSVDSLLDERPDDPDKRLLLERKGRILDHLGDMKTHDKAYGEAEMMLTKALRCMEKSNSNIGKATVLYHIGYLRHERRKFAEAEKYYYKSLAILERWFGKLHPKIADVLDHLAGLLGYPCSGPSYTPQKAEELYRRALHIRQHVYGSDHIMVATTLYHLGKLLMTKSGELAKREASEVLKRALDIRTMKLGYNHNLTRAIKVTLAKFEKTRPSTAVLQLEGSYARTNYQFGLLEQDILQTPPATRRALKQPWVQPQSSSLLHTTLRRQHATEEVEEGAQAASDTLLTPLTPTPQVVTPHLTQDDVTTNVVTSHVVTQDIVTQNVVTKDVSQNDKAPDVVSQDVVDTSAGVNHELQHVDDDRERTSSDTAPRQYVISTVDDASDMACHTDVNDNADILSDDVKCRRENVAETHTDVVKQQQTVSVTVNDDTRSDTVSATIIDDTHSDVMRHHGVSVTINDDVVIIGDDQGQSDLIAGQTQSGDRSLCPDAVNGNTHHSKRDINGNDTLSHDIQLGVGPNLVTSHLCIDSLTGTKSNSVTTRQRQTLQVDEQRRSKSATPLDLFNRYGRNRFKTRAHHSARSSSRSVPASTQPVTPSSHLRRCHIPDQFAYTPQNGYSAVHGPHSSLESLAGEPDAPRKVSRDLVHMCTWYHVPGRYPTMHKPYVPKRLLRRMRLKKWQAAFDDYMLAEPNACLSADTDSEGTEMSDGPLITYFNNP